MKDNDVIQIVVVKDRLEIRLLRLWEFVVAWDDYDIWERLGVAWGKGEFDKSIKIFRLSPYIRKFRHYFQKVRPMRANGEYNFNRSNLLEIVILLLTIKSIVIKREKGKKKTKSENEIKQNIVFR